MLIIFQHWPKPSVMETCAQEINEDGYATDAGRTVKTSKSLIIR
jgi:hypothetical protein